MRMNSFFVRVALILSAAMTFAGHAFALCSPINTVPATIKFRGTYCLAFDMTLQQGQMPAIAIASDDVTLDLQGLSLVCGDELGCEYGILSFGGHSQIRIRNGVIHGFNKGVSVKTASAIANNVELSDLTLESTGTGIDVEATNHAVIRNVFVQAQGFGVFVDKSEAVSILDSQIHGDFRGVAFNTVTNSSLTGSRVYGAPEEGVDVYHSKSMTIYDNTISLLNGAGGTGNIGVDIVQSQDVAVIQNRIFALTGISYDESSSGKYRDNLITAKKLVFPGQAVDVGNNN